MYLKDFAECLDKLRKPINAKKRSNRVGNIPYYGATGKVGYIDDYLTNEQLVLLGEDGAPFFDLIKNKAYIIEGKAWINNHVHILRSIYGEIGNKYLVNYLNIFNYTNYVNGTTRLKLTQARMNMIPISVPPLSEQKRISELIDRLFEKLDEAKEKALSALNTFELRKAKILHLAIQGKLSKQLDEYKTAEELYEKIQIEKEKLISEGKLKKQKKLPEIYQDEIPFEIPKSWKWVRLGESSINIHYGYTTSSTLKGNFKLLRITDIQNNKVDWNKVPFCDIDDSEYSKYALKDGDILIARTGGTVGKSYRVEFLSDKCVFASYLIRVIVSKEMNSKYLKYFMENSLYWNQLKVGITGTGQPNVNAVTLSKLFLPLPPLEEQNEIVKLLDNIFEKEEKAKKLIESTLNKIELIKKSILARAVRGEL